MLLKKLLLMTTCASVLALSACTTSSTGRSKIAFISPDKLNAMGASSFEEMKKNEKISQNEKINKYVQCVADAIIKHVPKSAHDGDWEVVVFDSEQVNAFALPGGKIGVYTQILKVAENQDQLAAIMGHEVGHVIEGHSNERLSSGQLSQVGLTAVAALLESGNVESRNMMMAGLGLGVQYGVMMPYGRAHEKEADIVGQNLMARSGFKPEAAITLWQNMAKLGGKQPAEFFSTHPSNQTRIDKLSAHLPTAQTLLQQSTDKPNCINPLK
jgi:predicted Zn-dependent protease